MRQVRLKEIASVRPSNVDKKSVEGEIPVQLCNYTDVYYNDYITAADKFMSATATAAQVASFTLRRGDVLMTKDSETAEDIAVPALVEEDLFAVLCGYHLALVRPNADRVDSRFLHRALSTKYVNRQFQVGATGVTRYGLRTDVIRNVRIPLPSLEEQRRIADFLDRETQRIDALVDAKRRMLDLLEEKWSALVTHMTSPEPLPQDWDEGPLSRWWTVIDCKHRTATYVDDGIPIVGTPDVRNGRLRLEGARRTTREDYLDLTQGQRKPSRGDIIYSRNASLGQAAYVDTDAEFCMGQDVCLITSKDNDQLFLAYQLSNSRVNQQVDQLVVGATFKRINVAEIRKLIVVRPPIHQQTEIAEELDSRQRSIRAVTKRLDRQISLLAEYRQALITKAVTGQLDEATLKGKKPADEVVGV